MPRPSCQLLRIALLLLGGSIVVFLPGCGDSGPPLGKVTGRVTYADGSIPQGGVAVIRFEVAKNSNAEIRKAADSDIQADGSYAISTLKPGDGAFYGAYKVVFTIFKSYRNETSLVAAKYTSAKTTPFECVVDSPSQVMDFTIDDFTFGKAK